MRQAIIHVTLIVRDYDEAIEYYCQKLNFTLLEDSYQPEQDKRWVVVAPPGSHGATLLLARASTPDKEGSSTAYLLSIYDEYISSYKDRSAMCEADTGIKLTALGSALSYIIVIDGQIVGVWKRTLRKGAVVIETDVFTRLTEAGNQAVAFAARRYGEFLNRSVVLA